MSHDYPALRRTAETALRAAFDGLQKEISDYPTPISGCDAQFNHLLAERQRLSRAVEALASDVFIATPRSPDQFAGIESR